jgi:hypothetical protein
MIVQPPFDMREFIEKVLSVVNEEGLSKGMLYYSSLISNAPKKRNQTNMGNAYTPVGQVTRPNPNFNKELTVWKNTKLFPFFLERGFSREELNAAWKVSIFKK